MKSVPEEMDERMSKLLIHHGDRQRNRHDCDKNSPQGTSDARVREGKSNGKCIPAGSVVWLNT
jgi:hypothetical protein